MKNPNDKTNIDFYKIYQDGITEYEEMVMKHEQNLGHTIDNDDDPDYILFLMHKVFMMKVNNVPMPRLNE